MQKRFLAAAALLAASALLAGCAPSSDTPPMGEPIPAVTTNQPPGAHDVETGETGGAASTGATDAAEQHVITTASMRVTVDDPRAAADAAAQVVASESGIVQQRYEHATTDRGPDSATLTLRVPAARVDAVIDAIGALGTLETLEVGHDDVTAHVRDLDVRVQTARASVERLTQLLATAADTATLLEIEEQLTNRTAELESMLAEQQWLANQVAMSTISVSLTSTTAAPRDEPATF